MKLKSLFGFGFLFGRKNRFAKTGVIAKTMTPREAAIDIELVTDAPPAPTYDELWGPFLQHEKAVKATKTFKGVKAVKVKGVKAPKKRASKKVETRATH